MRITSTQNPTVKFVRSLERARVRREEGLYLAEGVRLVTEAVDTHQPAPLVLYDPDLLTRSQAGSRLLSRLPNWAQTMHEVDARVLAAASQTEHPGGVLAVLRRPPQNNLAACAAASFGVVLDGIADPGNAGTILRTCAAAAVSYLVATPGSVDLFSPKVVRAAMGAHFRLRLFESVPWDDLRAALRSVTFVGTDVEQGTNLYQFRWPHHVALVTGSEAEGVTPQGRLHCAARVRIPMATGVESLNVSVATAIIIYHALGPTLHHT